MLEITLKKLNEILKKHLAEETDQKKAYKLFSTAHSGLFIYPGLVKQKLHIPIVKVYDILDDFEEEGIATHYFEIVCPYCSKSVGNMYKTYVQIPDLLYCDSCEKGVEKEFEGRKNSYLIYKVNENV